MDSGRSRQREVRTTGGEDNGTARSTTGGEDSEEYNGRRGQLHWWILKRAVCTFKRAFLIKRVVFN